jgi:hypothetical protein
MADLIRFVDSVASSPTLRLDLNDESSFWVKSFSAPPPRLRRSMASNAMRDGVSVGSSTYDARTLTLEIQCRKSTQDLAATEMQKLWRELDRATNYLMYQPTGATKPVFFRTFRSDASQLADVMAQAAMRTFTIELLAEPFAVGLPETFSGTFSWDGASSTGFKASSMPTIIGDAAAPLTLDVTLTNLPASAWLVAQATPSTLTSPDVVRADTNSELGTVGTDTSFSTGLSNIYWSTNAASVTFATNANLVARLTGIAPTGFYGGTYRLLAHLLEGTGGTGSYTVRAGRGNSAGVISGSINTGETKTVAIDGAIGGPIDTFADLGLFRVPFGTDSLTQASGFAVSESYWSFEASRTAGSGTLRIDGLLWVPAIMDDAALNSTALITPPASASTTTPKVMRVDADAESVSLFVGTNVSDTVTPASVAGGLPFVAPGCTNSLWLIPTAGAAAGTATTTTIAYSASYYPRYLFVRPASS